MITTTNSRDIYQRGNDYDQSELLYGPSPCGPYVTLQMFNKVINQLIVLIKEKQDKLDIGFIEYTSPEPKED